MEKLPPALKSDSSSENKLRAKKVCAQGIGAGRATTTPRGRSVGETATTARHPQPLKKKNTKKKTNNKHLDQTTPGGGDPAQGLINR